MHFPVKGKWNSKRQQHSYQPFYSLEILKEANVLSTELIPSSKFLFYIERVIQCIHPGHISTQSETALNGDSNVVQCLLSLFKTDFIFWKPCFHKTYLVKTN